MDVAGKTRPMENSRDDGWLIFKFQLLVCCYVYRVIRKIMKSCKFALYK